jgi:hypothetical protein
MTVSPPVAGRFVQPISYSWNRNFPHRKAQAALAPGNADMRLGMLQANTA